MPQLQLQNYRPDIADPLTRFEMGIDDPPYIRIPPAPPPKKAEAPEPAPKPKSSGGGSSGGEFSKAWADYNARHEALGMSLIGEVQATQEALQADFNRIMKGFRTAKKTANEEYSGIRDIYDTDLAGMPSVSMKLPGSMGGGTVPLAPGKYSDMYTQQANARTGITGAKLQAVLASLTGEGQAADSKAARSLQGSGIKGNAIQDMMGGRRASIGSMMDYDLGLKGLTNQMAIAQGGWANNEALAKLAIDNDRYLQQQKLNELDDFKPSWLQPILTGTGMIAGGYLGGSIDGLGVAEGAKLGGLFGSTAGGYF